MRQKLTDRNGLFSRATELGPVARDGLVEIDPAARARQMYGGRCHAFADLEHGRERFASPGQIAGAIAGSAPKSYDGFAAVIHTDGGAEVAAPGDVPLELIPDAPETPGDGAIDHPPGRCAAARSSNAEERSGMKPASANGSRCQA